MEKDIQKKIKSYLAERGFYVVKVVSATKAGVPDILACCNGLFVGIEVKTPRTLHTVSSLQAYNLESIIKAGGIAFVASSVEDAENKLKELK